MAETKDTVRLVREDETCARFAAPAIIRVGKHRDVMEAARAFLGAA